MKSQDQLNEIVAEAVNKSLSDICSSAAQSVLFFLEKNGSIKSRTKIENLENLAEGLEKIFGFGAKIIEKRILKTLCMKLQLPEPKDVQDDFEFSKVIEQAIKAYDTKKSKKTKPHDEEAISAQISLQG